MKSAELYEYARKCFDGCLWDKVRRVVVLPNGETCSYNEISAKLSRETTVSLRKAQELFRTLVMLNPGKQAGSKALPAEQKEIHFEEKKAEPVIEKKVVNISKLSDDEKRELSVRLLEELDEECRLGLCTVRDRAIGHLILEAGLPGSLLRELDYVYEPMSREERICHKGFQLFFEKEFYDRVMIPYLVLLFVEQNAVHDAPSVRPLFETLKKRSANVDSRIVYSNSFTNILTSVSQKIGISFTRNSIGFNSLAVDCEGLVLVRADLGVKDYMSLGFVGKSKK